MRLGRGPGKSVSLRRLGTAAQLLSLPFFGHPKSPENRRIFVPKTVQNWTQKKGSLAGCLLYMWASHSTRGAIKMRLLESKPDKKGRSVGGALFSIILHVSIIFLAVLATARAGISKAEKPKEEKVNFVAVKKDEPPPPPKEEVKPKPEPPKPKKTPAPPKIEQPKVAAPAPPQGFKVVAPPVSIPTTMP